MAENLFIRQLTLLGLRKNYTVSFKRGLNLITGPTSTGKSTIVEMINYALGSKEHKDYIEVRENCTDVEIEIIIAGNTFLIRRPLFDYERPAKLFRWVVEENAFSSEFELLPIDSPANEASLSAFLLNELGLFNIHVANQSFSFRDIFKFCYLKQTEIDTENIMHEKHWGPSIKRKPTFEIIFNMFDTLLSELKAELKKLSEKIEDLEKKRLGVYEFLKSLDLLDKSQYDEKKKEFEDYLAQKKIRLYSVKSESRSVDDPSNEIEHSIIDFRNVIERIEVEINEQRDYINKLSLLRNQYRSELDKIDFLIEGAVSLNRYNFEVCPSCLNELQLRVDNGCELCGSSLKNLSSEEVAVYKSESRRLGLKFNKLAVFINEQTEQVRVLFLQKEESTKQLHSLLSKLDHLRKAYVSPYVEEIEKLNYEIGEVTTQLRELDKSLSIMAQFHNLTYRVSEEQRISGKLKSRIKEIESNTNDKEEIVNEISQIFTDILESFHFPKLSTSYINIKDYLPYVRGRKYDQIGSLGSVTLINLAYYLSILLLGIENGNNHPGLLVIDTPRKNLGADPANDEEAFKDEKIFNSIIRFLIELDKKSEHIQIIVINNGFPEFVPDKYFVKQFNGNGVSGLIDDAMI
ncbi:AAA family ATPase [Paenibacillus alba]|uniref:Nuclease SbcCD subunit C n=1 Tax=Paenibacillus alba TaxID=1197127 RepID=A0ABU6G557_9BACL|nr:AAA family ATPase [Paenibacillus alba]MEC0228745.1 AAA family ATPase [Paenibacillus alba]